MRAIIKFICILFLLPLVPYAIAAIFLVAMLLTGILESIIPNGGSEIAEAQRIWEEKHPYVEPTPEPKVPRATRVYRGTNGQWVMLPPTNPDGSFNLNSGM